MKTKTGHLIARDGDLCHYCGRKVVRKKRGSVPRAVTRDHIIPRSIGGPDDSWNLVLACAACNSSRPERQLPTCLCVRCIEAVIRFSRLTPIRVASS